MVTLASVALAMALGGGAEVATGPVLRGTFLQFRVDDRWTDGRLKELVLDARRLGLSRIVVQWTLAGDKAFYPSGTFESVSEPPLELLLSLCDKFDLKVRVGLTHDPEFWDRITLQAPLHDVEIYLAHLRQRSTTVARELLPLVAQHPSFDGWFLTEEVDDVNWLQPERRALLHSHLGDVRRTLRALGSPASVAVSGFSNAHCDPQTLEAFWRELLTATDIDAVFFQDGVGAHKLALPHLSLYLTAMKRAVVATGRTLSVVVELFDQVGGWPIKEGPFRAVPTDIDRLARQLTIAGEASTGDILAFSVPDYMLPGAAPGAERLFSEYMKRYAQ